MIPRRSTFWNTHVYTFRIYYNTCRARSATESSETVKIVRVVRRTPRDATPLPRRLIRISLFSFKFYFVSRSRNRPGTVAVFFFTFVSRAIYAATFYAHACPNRRKFYTLRTRFSCTRDRTCAVTTTTTTRF